MRSQKLTEGRWCRRGSREFGRRAGAGEPGPARDQERNIEGLGVKKENQAVGIDLDTALQKSALEHAVENLRGPLQLGQAEHDACNNE
jgi:hypothetical protein